MTLWAVLALSVSSIFPFGTKMVFKAWWWLSYSCITMNPGGRKKREKKVICLWHCLEIYFECFMDHKDLQTLCYQSEYE